MKLLIISDDKYYCYDNNIYGTNFLSIKCRSECMGYKFDKIIIVGRIYRTKEKPDMQLAESELFEVVGVEQQAMGFKGYIQSFGKNLSICIREMRRSDLIWINSSSVSGLISSLLYPLCRKGKIAFGHLHGDFDILKIKGQGAVVAYIAKGLYRLSYHNLDFQVFVSEALKDKYAQDQKAVVANVNSVTDTMIDYHYKQRKENELLQIIFVGRLAVEKGILDLLDVVKNKENWRLDIIGEGEQRQEIEQFIEKYQLHNIKLHGYINGKMAVLEKIKNAHILVLPSYSEGLGLVLLEAMSVGTAVVGSNVGGIPCIIENKHNGLLFAPGNRQDLEAQLEKFDQDEKFRVSCIKNAYNTAKFNTAEQQMQIISNEINRIKTSKII